jgi:hypothetical protein
MKIKRNGALQPAVRRFLTKTMKKSVAIEDG